MRRYVCHILFRDVNESLNLAALTTTRLTGEPKIHITKSKQTAIEPPRLAANIRRKAAIVFSKDAIIILLTRKASLAMVRKYKHLMPNDPYFEEDRFEAWSEGLSKIWLGALWGFAEATAFFLVPDIIITASSLFSPRRSFIQMLAVLIGALLGGALLYTAADKFPDEAKTFVLHVPFVKASMLDRVDHQIQARGVWAMFRGALVGIPYKTYAVTAPRFMRFEMFMAISLPSRLERFFLSWSIGSLLGLLFRRQIQASPVVAVGLLTICWIGFYTYYWSELSSL